MHLYATLADVRSAVGFPNDPPPDTQGAQYRDTPRTPQSDFAATLAAVQPTGRASPSTEALVEGTTDDYGDDIDWGPAPVTRVRTVWFSEADRPWTTITDVEKLVRAEGPYAEVSWIRKVLGLWESGGLCDTARPHYDKWQVAPNEPEREEHFYDALFEQLRNSGTFIDLVDETMLDWRKSGRLERQVRHRLIVHADCENVWAKDDMRNSFLAWYARGPDLERWASWHLLYEADHASRRLASKMQLPLPICLAMTIGQLDAWHESDRIRHRTARGQNRRGEHDETRLLHKKLILKQLLDTQLAVDYQVMSRT